MGFEFPNECDKVKIPEISDAAKGVFDSVMNGSAFKNPFADAMGGVGDLLSGTDGIAGKLEGLLGDATGADLLALEGLKDSLGLGDLGGGLMAQLDEIKAHTDMMSGVGDLDAFSERLGIATAMDSIKQQIGEQQGQFANMFSSFEDIGGQLESLTSRFGDISSVLDGGLDNLSLPDLDNLKSLALDAGSNMLGKIASDNAAFSGAKNLIQKMSISNIITTDNCYVSDLLNNMIGSSDLLQNLPTAVQEMASDIPEELNPQEKLAVEQSKIAKIEEIKSKGIKSENVAELIGDAQANDPEEVEKVKSRPVYRHPSVDWENPVTPPMLNGIKTRGGVLIGEPMWDESEIRGESGRWIQWTEAFTYYLDDGTAEHESTAETKGKPYSIHNTVMEWSVTFNDWVHSIITPRSPIAPEAKAKIANEGIQTITTWDKAIHTAGGKITRRGGTQTADDVGGKGYFLWEKFQTFYNVRTKQYTPLKDKPLEVQVGVISPFLF